MASSNTASPTPTSSARRSGTSSAPAFSAAARSNAPLVNYYEHGTFLTLNHAHTALFGAFGLLGIGLIYFCLRYVAAEQHPFGEAPGRWAFWLYNGGPGAVDRLQLLPDRLAATGCGL